MRRNFCLQHPLMAMNDPRMQNLLDEEGLRGIGAYWIIIEKLSMLPEPRTQLEYLRPFCKNRKIPFVYLKKIILKYKLFNLEEDDFFSVEELNPVKKKEQKMVKNSKENVDSNAKNDEKLQKTSRNNSENHANNDSNSLNNNDIAKADNESFKENIKDIITAATVEEKDATATTAINHSCPLNICDDYGQSQQMLHPVRPWQNMVDELTTRTPWLETACMQSCYGELLMRNIQKAVEIFKCHIELYDKGGDLLTMSEVRRYFVNYTKAGKPTSQALRETLIAFEAKQRATLPPNAYLHEQLINGKRTYLGCLIPDDAPARPSDTAFWNEQEHRWISQR